MNLQLFFSHAWNDKAGGKLKKLLLFLQKDYNVWLDKKQIDAGNHINETVAKGIEACDIFIIAWSQNAFNSKGVLFELETATKLNKHILPLLIDKFDINQSPYLAGKEYFDFSGDEADFATQQVYLTNFLQRKEIEILKKQLAGTPNEAAITALEKEVTNHQNTLIELEDTLKRQQLHASGNDDSNVYVQSSLNTFDKMLDASDDEGKLMLAFSARVKEISEKFPLKEDDAVKKRLTLKAIEEIDPAGKHKKLADLKKVLQQDTNLQAHKVTAATTLQPGDQILQILQAYKTSVEKTKTAILDKTKNGLESIPLFNFIASINKELTALEMSYVTNSPVILEKLYATAIQSGNKELQGLVTILIQHISPQDLQQCEALQKINAYAHYAYLINNTARLLVQAKAVRQEDVSLNLISNIGLDKVSKLFFKDDWKEKAEQFLATIKNNYGIKDNNLQWLSTAATIIGVALVSEGVIGSFSNNNAVANNSSGAVYFEDKMAAAGFTVPGVSYP
jgi:hypothetical protein